MLYAASHRGGRELRQRLCSQASGSITWAPFIYSPGWWQLIKLQAAWSIARPAVLPGRGRRGNPDAICCAHSLSRARLLVPVPSGLLGAGRPWVASWGHVLPVPWHSPLALAKTSLGRRTGARGARSSHGQEPLALAQTDPTHVRTPSPAANTMLLSPFSLPFTKWQLTGNEVVN